MIALILAVVTSVAPFRYAWTFDAFDLGGAKYDAIATDDAWNGRDRIFGFQAVLLDSSTSVGVPVHISCTQNRAGGFFCESSGDWGSFRLLLDRDGSGTIGQIRSPAGEAISNRPATFNFR